MENGSPGRHRQRGDIGVLTPDQLKESAEDSTNIRAVVVVCCCAVVLCCAGGGVMLWCCDTARAMISSFLASAAQRVFTPLSLYSAL